MDDSARTSGNKLDNILLVVVAVTWLGLAAGIFIPNRIGRGRNPRIACIAVLKMLEGAKATWALDNHEPSDAIPADSDLFGPQKYISTKPVCPVGGKYTLASVSEKPRCSIPGHTI